MERFATELSATLLDLWSGASLSDFLMLVLSIVVLGWFLSRYFPG